MSIGNAQYVMPSEAILPNDSIIDSEPRLKDLQ